MLTSLINLDISNIKNNASSLNTVTGDLLPLAQLTNLQSLNVSGNVLGIKQFPEAVLNLTNLIDLRIDNTMITGPFPTRISNLQKLQYLYMGNNSMDGPLPKGIGTMTNLVELTLWDNLFKSVIPPELGNLVNLTYLNLNRCNLFGGLPPELGKLKNLQRLDFYKNGLTGPIPDEWQTMVNLGELRIEQNSLYGHINSWLLELPKLVTLILFNNQLYGPIPSVNSTHLQVLNLDCNYLTGDDPTTLNISNFLWSFNCFNDPGANGTVDYECSRALSCVPFEQATQNGVCPPCPAGQMLFNSSLCVCIGDQSASNKQFPVAKVVGALGGSLGVVFLLGLMLLWRWKRNRKLRHMDFFTVKEIGQGNQHWEAPKGVQRYSLQELIKATGGFDKAHEIGSGGFGKVFVGNFANGKTLAIKRASGSSTSSPGQSEFRTEVLLLSRLHHKNLVHLEGFCDDSGLQILVYEFMKNGNLHSHLFRKDSGKYLDWYKRLEIAMGVAQGLEYLHSFADPPVIHRDVKPSNILLDDNLIAKVADFGISKVSPEFDTHVSTKPAGTAGYFDPQYFIRRQLTTASDVYSFGVVLLELVTGQRAIDHNREEINLMEWAKPRLKSEGIESIADPSLGNDYPKGTYHDVAELALQCTEFEKSARPTMKTVTSVLEPHLQALQPPTPKKSPLKTWGSYESLILRMSTDGSQDSWSSSSKATTQSSGFTASELSTAQ